MVVFNSCEIHKRKIFHELFFGQTNITDIIDSLSPIFTCDNWKGGINLVIIGFVQLIMIEEVFKGIVGSLYCSSHWRTYNTVYLNIFFYQSLGKLFALMYSIRRKLCILEVGVSIVFRDIVETLGVTYEVQNSHIVGSSHSRMNGMQSNRWNTRHFSSNHMGNW
jgi:hypothetical protein